jgi:hypothetical protein
MHFNTLSISSICVLVASTCAAVGLELIAVSLDAFASSGSFSSFTFPLDDSVVTTFLPAFY